MTLTPPCGVQRLVIHSRSRSTMQREFVDRRTWPNHAERASAIFECWRHPGRSCRSRDDFADLHTAAVAVARSTSGPGYRVRLLQHDLNEGVGDEGSAVARVRR